MRRLFFALLVSIATIWAVTVSVHATQSCGPLNCTPAAAEPFNHIYTFGTSVAFTGDGAGGTDSYMRIVQTQVMSADTHWVVLRTGSITAFSCNYQISVETSAGTISFEIRAPASDDLVETVTTAGATYYDWVQTYAAGTHAVVAAEGIDLFLNFGNFEGTLQKVYCLVEVSGTL